MKINRLYKHHLLALLSTCILVHACNRDHRLQHFTVDSAESGMEWKGYLKDGSGNNGTIKVTGNLFADHTGKIVSGEIVLPLSTLININLPTDDLKAQIIRHLQSPDFFNMAAHPEIRFRIDSLTPDHIVPHTYEAVGSLTMLGNTNTIRFPVKILSHRNKLEVTGETSINRTLWGMTYATDENAPGGMYVKPNIDIQFRLVALNN